MTQIAMVIFSQYQVKSLTMRNMVVLLTCVECEVINGNATVVVFYLDIGDVAAAALSCSK
jgi:hypothetical protein